MTIICKNISKAFSQNTDKEVSALQEVSFSAEENEFISIVGPSGCGKTTLLKIIDGLIQPDTGKIEFSKAKIKNVPNSVLIFQDQGLFPWFTIFDNIGLGLELQGVKKKHQKKLVLDFMDRDGLNGFADHYPHELSGGMNQRVALTRAFLSSSEILLMDEPFAALDAQTRIILREELLQIWRSDRKTVFFVTHDIEEAIFLGDKVFVMSNRPGRILEEIKINFSRPRNMDVIDTKEFIKIKRKIWKTLEHEIRKGL